MQNNALSKSKQLTMIDEDDEEKYEKIISDIKAFNKFEEELKEQEKMENEHNNKVLMDVY